MEQLDPGLRRAVADAPVARLATVRPDGRPHLVPVTFALDGDTIVTAVDHKPKATTSLQRLRNIEAHPVASVLVDHYDDDWSRLWYLHIRADAHIESPAAPAAIALLRARYPPYRTMSIESHPLIRLTPTHTHLWRPPAGFFARHRDSEVCSPDGEKPL